MYCKALASLPSFLTAVLFVFTKGFNLQKVHGLVNPIAYKKLQYNTTKLIDKMTDLENNARSYPIYWYDEVVSTMDTSKELVKQVKPKHVCAVVSEYQSKGRGTKGRNWLFGSKNVFMTIIIHRSLLPRISFNYLPLRVGTLIGSALAPYITDGSLVKLKWPNDVLINGQKTCGVLIEFEDDYFLIGIGCNVMTAPTIQAIGAEGGRPATCLAEHNSEIKSYLDLEISSGGISENLMASNTPNIPLPLKLETTDFHKMVAIDLFKKFETWIEEANDSNSLIIQDFSRNMDYSIQKLRDISDDNTNKVEPVQLNEDGTLLVRFLHDNSTISLIADYLW